MQSQLANIVTIPKESLAQVKFVKTDVLAEDPARKKLRGLYLHKAQTMGNLFKHKVKLYFKTLDHELLAVETTIWSADEEYITVKGGSIPTKSVWAIDF